MSSEYQELIIDDIDPVPLSRRRFFWEIARRLLPPALSAVTSAATTYGFDKQALLAAAQKNHALNNTVRDLRAEIENIHNAAIQEGSPTYKLEQIQNILDDQPSDSTQ